MGNLINRDLIRKLGEIYGSDEIRVFPVTEDDDGEIIMDDTCKSKPILGFCVWEGEPVILYEEVEECM